MTLPTPARTASAKGLQYEAVSDQKTRVVLFDFLETPYSLTISQG